MPTPFATYGNFTLAGDTPTRACPMQNGTFAYTIYNGDTAPLYLGFDNQVGGPASAHHTKYFVALAPGQSFAIVMTSLGGTSSTQIWVNSQAGNASPVFGYGITS